MRRRQTTLARDVVCEGVGLFEGTPVRLVIQPASKNQGVVFVRTDLDGNPEVKATVENVVPDFRRTTLACGSCRVCAVEHLLGALAGLHVDNVRVLMDASEPPVLDGSALPLVNLILEAGVRELDAERRCLRVRAPVRVGSGTTSIELLPGAGGGLHVSYLLEYPDKGIASQSVSFEMTPEIFAREIAPARSFVLQEEVESLRSRGLGKGATLDNTVVLDDTGDTGSTVMRFADEPARHKVLDVVGDLSVLNADIVGRLVASRSGHALNSTLTKELRKHMDNKEERPTEPVMDITQIRKFLPHRYPFLLVDRVIEMEPGKRALGYKNLTANEEFFQGHFPERPMMPGVLQLEAMAQLGGLLMLQTVNADGMIAVLLSMDKVKFRKPVVPGDRLMLEARADRIKPRTGQVSCTASVDGQVASEAIIKFMLVDYDENKDDKA